MFKNFYIGIKSYSGAFSLINKLGLWSYFFIPILISIITAISIGFLAWSLSDNIGALIAKIWIWEWGAKTFRTIIDIISGIAIVAIGLILYKHIIMALSAPFMSPVSEKIEEHFIGKKVVQSKSQFFPLLWRGIRVNVRNLFMELFFTILILLIGLIPIVGFITTPILFLVQAYYAGYGNMDYTLERHFNFSKSNAFVRSHSGIATGIGSVFMLLLLIPVIGIILVLPLSVTAASVVTLNTIKTLEETKL